ncbi:DUF2336 domain-containing protein [Stappia sp. MMSF_3263]|uniref:DUF2336 domain-containing protein n=1 Tax=Stappia sp. MMSF_3263 TaxID=3046693 RepID=UPI00273D1B83|nr:DUF2336 domain-containing protein [Stappia sp. MMSF_3263]
MIVQQFLRWMADAPVTRRAEATSALARAYLHSAMTEADREAAEAAMTILLDDPAVQVRRALAEALSRSADAPREVILALSGDLPEVASLVLERSPVLLDMELVDAVAGFADPLPAAVARRVDLGSQVAAAIAEVGSLQACQALAENREAEIPRFSMVRLVERHGTDAILREALMARGETPIEIRQMLLKQVGDLLSDHPLVRRGLKDERARAVVAEARERATVTLASTAAPHETPALVEHLVQSGQLTPALLLRAVCTGNIVLFTAALARLSGLGVSRVEAVLGSARGLPLRALLSRAGLPSRTHGLFQVAIGVWRDLAREVTPVLAVPGNPAVARLLIGEVLDRYQEQDGVEADDLVVMLRRFSAEIARDAARAYMDRTLAAA